VLFLRLRDLGDQRPHEAPRDQPVRTVAQRVCRRQPAGAPRRQPGGRRQRGARGRPVALRHPEGPTFSAEDLAAARALLAAPEGGRPGDGVVVVLGRPSLAEGAQVTAAAAAALAEALPGARFLPALRRGNVFGALEMGLAPGLLPGRVSLDAGREWFAAAGVAHRRRRPRRRRHPFRPRRRG